MLHMAAAAVSMVCQLGSRSRGSLPEAMAARGGRISTPASQALGERLSGRKTGSVREGQSEARLTIWRAPLTKRPAPLAPHGSGTTACSRLAPVRTLSAVERRGSSPQLSRAPRRRTYVHLTGTSVDSQGL